MKFKAYSNPHTAGWLGWFEDEDGTTFGWLALDNTFHWHDKTMQDYRERELASDNKQEGKEE